MPAYHAQWSNELRFDADLSKFENLVPEELAKVTKRLTFDLADRVISNTPVREGFAKGSWLVSRNKPGSGFANRPDREGGATKAAAQAEIATIEPFDRVYLSSDCPYIIPLEEGHAAKSEPIQEGGFVAAAVNEINAKYSR
jgi:hypothetical protein